MTQQISVHRLSKEGDLAKFYPFVVNRTRCAFSGVSLMEKVKSLAKFILGNFGPILVFYVSNHFFGLRVAVLASILWTVGEVCTYRLKGKSLSTFFKFSAGITILFGIIDIYLQRTVFFKYEASVTTFLVGCYFGSTLLSEKPLIQEFAEAQGRIKDKIDPDMVYLLRFLTIIWTSYLFIKAGFYAIIAGRYTLEEGLAIRGVIGNVSFYGLLFVTTVGANKIKSILAWAKLLPSVRNVI
jgi:intracellular septation protein A